MMVPRRGGKRKDFRGKSAVRGTGRVTRREEEDKKRRKANTPSPKVIQKKKRKEGLERGDDGDGFERDNGGRRGRRFLSLRRKRGRGSVSSPEQSNMDESDDDEEDACKPNGRGNHQPSEALREETPEVDDYGGRRSRPRKRMSIRAPEATSCKDARKAAATDADVETENDDVEHIYATACQMFDANAIKPQNSFSLRLLDCINEMVNSPGYDKTNLQLTSSTLEIGTKIYTCRVDNTYSHVLSLASEISLHQLKNKKDEEGNQRKDSVDTEENAARNKRKKVIKKRGRFVEEDESKLLADFNQSNMKFVTRRNLLKKKFDEDLDFDYLGFILDQENDENPTENEENIKNYIKVPNSLINASDMGQLDFLPFLSMPAFDPEVVNVWGLPLDGSGETSSWNNSGFQIPRVSPTNEFSYDPSNRPKEYPDEGTSKNILTDTGSDFCKDDDHDEDEDSTVSVHDIQTLDNLDNYFQRVRSILHNEPKYGWCGPNFARPKPTWPSSKRTLQKRPTRAKKQPIDFTKIDWSNKKNQFNTTEPWKTMLDEKVIESWAEKPNIPYLGCEITSYEDDFDIIDFQNENDPKYIPRVLRLFTVPERSVFGMGKIHRTKGNVRHPNFVRCPAGQDDEDDHVEISDFNYHLTKDEDHPLDEAASKYSSQISGKSLSTHNDDALPRLLSESDNQSVQFIKKPKPIDMSQLKLTILKSLISELKLDGLGQPILEEETKVDLASLMMKVLKQLDKRTEKFLSVPIFIVALMHVVGEKRLLVLDDTTDPNCPVVICKGRNFKLEHNLSPVDGLDYE